MKISEIIAETNEFTEGQSSITELLEQRVKRIEETTKNLEKKLEREIKFHWNLLNIFLFLNIIIFLYREIFPFIIRWLYLLF